jgi:hypothetical protein
MDEEMGDEMRDEMGKVKENRRNEGAKSRHKIKMH